LQQKIARLAMGIKTVLLDDVIELKQRAQGTCVSRKVVLENTALPSEIQSSLHSMEIVLTQQCLNTLG
jgi:hypothetical protein